MRRKSMYINLQYWKDSHVYLSILQKNKFKYLKMIIFSIEQCESGWREHNIFMLFKQKVTKSSLYT